MARVTLIPTLAAMRDLYEQPRDMKRFHAYIDLLKGDSNDVAVPVVAFNPMAKPHVLARVHELIALDAEGIARAACASAEKHLTGEPGDWRVALVVPDDIAGGWTDRYLTDAQIRFEGASEVKRGFATVALWVSETPDAATIRARTLAAVARRSWQRKHGDPQTLREMIAQEAHAAAFAGAPLAAAAPGGEPISPKERAVLERHLDAMLYATRFACMYGDAAAERAGYPALGLSEFAGLRHAGAMA